MLESIHMDAPNAESLRFAVSEYAHVLAENGDAFEGATLVLPTNEYFPDTFERDAESVARLLARMIAYTPLADDLEVALGFADDQAPKHGHGDGCGDGGCGAGACGTGDAAPRIDGVADEGNGYRVTVHVADTASPARLTAALSRGVGALLLCEAGEEQDRDVGARSEVWAAAAGLGPMLLGGAHVVTKSCSGLRVHRGTALSLEELSFLVALFCSVNAEKPGRLRANLAPMQREAFGAAWSVVRANAALVRTLRDTPELLVDGVFTLEGSKGLLGRLFGARSEGDAPPANEVAPRPSRARDPEEQRRLEDARALVDEAFGK